MFSFKNISIDEVRKNLASKEEHMRSLMEINEELISAIEASINGGLKDLLGREKISTQTYDDQLKQSQDELEFRLQARTNLNQQLERLTQLKSQTQSFAQGLVIDSTMARDDLKQVIALTKIRLDTAQGKEKLILETIQQALESCVTFLDEKGTFETREIPFLPNEEKYILRVLVEVTNKSKVGQASEYFNMLADIEKVREQISEDKSLSRSERIILDNLYSNISKEITTELHNLVNKIPFNSEDYNSRIDAHITSAKELSQKIQITTGFKGFINWVCEKLNKKPLFTTSKDLVSDDVQVYKNQIRQYSQKIDTASEEQDTAPGI